MPTIDPFKATALPNNGGNQPVPTKAPPPATYTGPINNTINNTPQGDALVQDNQQRAAQLGVQIPGVSTPSTTTSPTGSTATSSTDQTTIDTAKAQAQKELDDWTAMNNQTSKAISDISNGVTPLNAGEQAQIDGLKQQYQKFIDQQTLTNTGAASTANIRGYQTGAAEYDPMFQAKTIGSIVSAGQEKIASLQTEEASAVATLTQAFHDKDIAAVKDAWSLYDEKYQERQKAFQKTVADTQTAIKAAQDAKIAADKTYFEQVTKPIQDLATSAAKNGADAKTIAAINAAPDMNAAIAAAGTSIQTSTNADIAQYLFYKQQAEQSGITPQSYADYQKAQATLANQAAYSKAYNTAAGSAAGAASVVPTYEDTSTGGGLGGTAKGGSILGATGLSIGAFNYLTGNTSALSRLTAVQRNQIMAEAQNYAVKHGVDVSTMVAQYKALNDVLASNIARENNAKIKGNDVTQTAQQLIASLTAANIKPDPLASVHGGGSSIGNLKIGNIIDIAAGKQVNNKFAIQYGTNISLLTNDLAGYLAATRTSSPTGNATPDDQDKRDAAQMVYNGLNAKGLQAFNDTIDQNVQKISAVSGQAVTDTQKQVWDLFGVADKYSSKTNVNDQSIQTQQKVQSSVDSYVQQNPDQANNISKLYNQGFTDEQVAEYLGLNQ